MAWIDDRFWSHHKVVGLSDKAFRAAVSAILYSHGFGLYGRLEPGHQRAVGASPRVRGELEKAGLWDSEGDAILIHDWDEHNGERDSKLEARRKADRERKKKEREEKKALKQAETEETSARTSRGQSRDSHADSPQDVTPHVTPMSSRAGGGAGAVDGVTSEEDRYLTTAPEPEPELHQDRAPLRGSGAGAAELNGQEDTEDPSPTLDELISYYQEVEAS